MLKDITLGQYFPVNSVIHKVDPRLKILMLIASIAVVVLMGNYYSLSLITLGFLAVLLLSKVPLSIYFKNLKAVLPIIIFTFIVNLLYVTDGSVLFEFWIIKISTGGISRSFFMALRVVLLILVSSTLTYTTTPNDLTDALERLLSPLKFIGLGNAVHTMSMMMTIALRFIPTLVEETEKTVNAQKARGADFETGKLSEKIKAVIPILIPLLISSIRRAYDLAEAMESRCYNGGVGRVRMKRMKLKTSDYIIAFIFIAFCAACLVLNYIF